MPDGATTNLRALAVCILEYEAALRKSPDAKNRSGAALLVCDRLRGPLGELMGVGGVRSLLARALALGCPEAPYLTTMRVKADGSLENSSDHDAKFDRHATADGELVLMSQLLGLLETFIGLPLTLRLVHATWPGMEKCQF